MRQALVSKPKSRVQALRVKHQGGQPAVEEGKRLAHALQLFACSFRRALRKAVSRILSDLASAAHVGRPLPAAAACAAAAAIADLLSSTGKAIRALEHVSSALQATVSLWMSPLRMQC